VHTVSRKSERLVNLTIALLATRRYLTKAEIFRTVEGYEGTTESKERMFERDKDDLRGLGIAIELGSFDPLFEDEAGYRITQANYQLALGELDGLDIGILSLAASAWSGAVLEKSSESALLKIQSIGVTPTSDGLTSLTPRLILTDPNFSKVTDAIVRRAEIDFGYVSNSLDVEVRKVQPFALYGRTGIWYLTGLDCERGENRTFRLDRIHGDVLVSKKGGRFEAPTSSTHPSFTLALDNVERAQMKIRKNRGHQLRALATDTELGEEWDVIGLPILNQSALLSLILWHGADVEVLSPADLRSSIVSVLKEIVATHG
jgi:proteasome accessory factor B